MGTGSICYTDTFIEGWETTEDITAMMVKEAQEAAREWVEFELLSNAEEPQYRC